MVASHKTNIMQFVKKIGLRISQIGTYDIGVPAGFGQSVCTEVFPEGVPVSIPVNYIICESKIFSMMSRRVTFMLLTNVELGVSLYVP